MSIYYYHHHFSFLHDRYHRKDHHHRHYHHHHHHHEYKLLTKCDNPRCLLVGRVWERQIEKRNGSRLQLNIFFKATAVIIFPIPIFIVIILFSMTLLKWVLLHHQKLSESER